MGWWVCSRNWRAKETCHNQPLSGKIALLTKPAHFEFLCFNSIEILPAVEAQRDRSGYH